MVTAETKIFSVAVEQGKSKESGEQMVYKVNTYFYISEHSESFSPLKKTILVVDREGVEFPPHPVCGYVRN